MKETPEETVEWIGNEIDILSNVDVNCQKTNQFVSKAAREKAGGSMTGSAAGVPAKV